MRLPLVRNSILNLLATRTYFIRISLCILAILLSTRSVVAQQRPSMVLLYWTRFPGAESCLDQRALEQLVESRLGRRVFTSHQYADIVIRGGIGRADSKEKWRVWFVMYDATGGLLGERKALFEAGDCEKVNEAISLVFTLMVESLKESELEHRSATKPLRPTPLTDEGSNWKLDIEPAVSGSLGLLPGPALGFTLVSSLTAWQVVRNLLAVTVSQSVRVTEGNLGADIAGWSVDAGGCLQLLYYARFLFESCLALQLGQLSGSGVSMSIPYTPRRWIISALAGPSLSFELSRRFILRLDLLAQIPLRSARFFYVEYSNNEGVDAKEITLWHPWPVLPIIRLGLGVQLL